MVSDIDIPISEADVTPATASSTVDQSKVDTLVSFGFSEELARKALKASVWISLPFVVCILSFCFLIFFWKMYNSIFYMDVAKDNLKIKLYRLYWV